MCSITTGIQHPFSTHCKHNTVCFIILKQLIKPLTSCQFTSCFQHKNRMNTTLNIECIINIRLIQHNFHGKLSTLTKSSSYKIVTAIFFSCHLQKNKESAGGMQSIFMYGLRTELSHKFVKILPKNQYKLGLIFVST